MWLLQVSEADAVWEWDLLMSELQTEMEPAPEGEKEGEEGEEEEDDVTAAKPAQQQKPAPTRDRTNKPLAQQQ